MSVKKKIEFLVRINNKEQWIEGKVLKGLLVNNADESVQFEEWWKLYDKKRSKSKSEKIFKRVINSRNVGELMEHTKKYIISTPDVQFRKDPSTYLNQESWNDVIIIKSNPEDEVAKEEEIREKRYLEKMRRQNESYNIGGQEAASTKEVSAILKNWKLSK